jgi:UDP-glucose 4-epimerase
VSLRKIILTGHRGYIGGALCEALVSRFGSDVVTMQCDLRDAGETRAELARLQSESVTIIHLATINRRDCTAYETYVANGAMLTNLLRATDGFAIRNFLFSSSTDVFGNHPRIPLTDSTPHQPDDWYGLSKSTGEWILRQAGVDHAVFRLPGIFGARKNERSLLRQLLQKGVESGRVELNARGEILRDFVYLDDLISLFLSWVEKPKFGSWNIASGKSECLFDSLTTLQALTGASFRIIRQEVRGPRDFDLVFEPSQLRAAFPESRIRPLSEASGHYAAAYRKLQEAFAP